MWRRWTSQGSGWMKRSNLGNEPPGFAAAEPNPSLLNEIGAMFAMWLQDRDT